LKRVDVMLIKKHVQNYKSKLLCVIVLVYGNIYWLCFILNQVFHHHINKNHCPTKTFFLFRQKSQEIFFVSKNMIHKQPK